MRLAIFLLRSSKLSFVQSRRKAELTHSSNLKAWDSFSLAAASTIIIFVTRLFAITVNCKDILANEPVKSSWLWWTTVYICQARTFLCSGSRFRRTGHASFTRRQNVTRTEKVPKCSMNGWIRVFEWWGFANNVECNQCCQNGTKRKNQKWV